MNATACRCVLLLCAGLAACASNEGAAADANAELPASAEVVLLGDGFARLDGARMPFDAAVLRLRLRTRQLTAEQRAAFVVAVQDGDALSEAAARQAEADRNRLFDELNAMDVGGARLSGAAR
jgi:hypothetical protein